ncbi:uncharacterized protein yc1106_09252 [Curvularia clavata]|uniref:Protection of telomeres protein 1 ssDNA-binding domain-containing protein n=1 Tax=Curvularia clavata TaxID=95742 RepID=A0A9Q8ZL09_CURCL|nr:uncharacterized protein yc1106_09252 [Curvularia clavata]
MQLPKGFTAIRDATSASSARSGVNLMGVITKYNGPNPTKGSDHCISFTIQDDFASGSIGAQSSISGRVFKRQDQLSRISASPGDILIVRKGKLTPWKNGVDCISERDVTSITVIPSRVIPTPDLSHHYQAGKAMFCSSTSGAPQPTTAEQMAAIYMKDASREFTQQIKQHIEITAPKTKRDSLIKDLQLNTFADVRAQVVNMYRHGMAGHLDMKITDYTANEAMFYYADPETEAALVTNSHWKGPYGYLTLSVTLYEANANWAAENLSEGDYVFIRNMRVKLSTSSKLEGALHQDKLNPSKVDISVLKNASDIAEINRRREEYEKRRGRMTAFDKLQSEPQDSSAAGLKKKRQAKKERQRAEKQAEQEELEKKGRKWEADRNGLNTNVRCAHVDIKPSTISEIIHNPHLHMQTLEKMNRYTLPFVNCRYRCHVRVVDVFPPKLDLFAHSLSDPNWAKSSQKSKTGAISTKERWEWGFVLLLEDAEVPRDAPSEKLRVVVNNNAAQHLLKMNARDLNMHPNALKQLENKLFILWGNLMELKTELRAQGKDLPLPRGDNRLQNKPFDTCIEEYGCEVPISEEHPFGYQRMHQLALTTINMD